MNSQDRVEGRVLEPAYEQFAERRISRAAGYESADVGGPVRNPGNREVQSCRDLAAEAKPIGVDVARPCGHSIALRAGKRRPREDVNALLVRRAALSLIHGPGILQRIG